MAVTSVSSGTSSVSLANDNPQRASLVVENTDANRLYVLLGSGTASATNYSFSLAQNENACVPGFSGPVQGIWAADGSGAALVTEISR